MSKVKIGLVQMSCTANKEENLEKRLLRLMKPSKKERK